MSQVSITNHLGNNLKPKDKPYCLRDDNLLGFGVKVNPSGSVKYIAEIWHKGKSQRKTLGEHPLLSIQQARSEALAFISAVKSGSLVRRKGTTLRAVFDSYISGGRLKPRTIVDYQEAILFYLIRDKGGSGGIPTYSQATKTMRILSALMNYAMADDILPSNPVVVLKKQKRVDRSIVRKTGSLPC